MLKICVILVLVTGFTSVPAQMAIPRPDRCWDVHTSGAYFAEKILVALQQNYSPITLIIKKYDNLITKSKEKCDGFIYIDENPKDVIRSIMIDFGKNEMKRRNTKLLIIYSGAVDFVLNDFVLKYLHYKSLNVFMVRMFHTENNIPHNILPVDHPFDKLSVNAPFINKTITIASSDVSGIKQHIKLQKWRPDFSSFLHRTLRVGISKMQPCAPFIIIQGNYRDGIELRIIEEVSKRWKVEYKEFDISAGETSFWDTASSDLENDHTDLSTSSGASNYYIGRNEVSHPYARVCATFLVPKPLPVNPSQYLYLPLSANVWIGVAVLSIVTCFLTHYIASIRNKTNNFQWRNSPYLSWTTCMWNTFSILSSQGAAVCPNQNSLRVFIMAWILVCLLVSVGYYTGYASLLTYPRFTKEINTMEDMVEHDLYWGINRTMTNTIRRVIEDVNSPFIPEIKRRFQPEHNDFDRFERLKGRQYALSIINLKNKFTAGTETLGNVSRSLKVIRECHEEFYRGFPLQMNSPYMEIFNNKINQIVESGIIDSWLADISFKNNLSYMKNFFSREVEANDAAPLQLNDLQGAFYLYCCGLILSVLVFMYEKWKCYCLSKH